MRQRHPQAAEVLSLKISLGGTEDSSPKYSSPQLLDLMTKLAAECAGFAVEAKR